MFSLNFFEFILFGVCIAWIHRDTCVSVYICVCACNIYLSQMSAITFMCYVTIGIVKIWHLLLWGHHCICSLSLTEMSWCGMWLYFLKKLFSPSINQWRLYFFEHFSASNSFSSSFEISVTQNVISVVTASYVPEDVFFFSFFFFFQVYFLSIFQIE